MMQLYFMLRHGFLLKLSEVEQMNKSIVDSYGTAANCDIAQEEADERSAKYLYGRKVL